MMKPPLPKKKQVPQYTPSPDLYIQQPLFCLQGSHVERFNCSLDVHYLACSCSQYNACSNLLIVGHYPSVMPKADYGLANTKQTAIT